MPYALEEKEYLESDDQVKHVLGASAIKEEIIQLSIHNIHIIQTHLEGRTFYARR